MNVLWIMTDQHRADCLGFMGHPAVLTPNLDRLARTGVVFENAFCQSPVCMASRAVLFTGRYPATVRVRGMGLLPPAETTFPEVLQRHGFRTGAFGKVHLTPEQYTKQQLHEDVPTLDWHRFAADGCISPIPDDPCKTNYGFQTHVGCEDILQGRFREWLRQTAPALLDAQPRRDLPPGAPRDLWTSPYPSAFHQTTFVASQAADFIAAQSDAKPWFTFCSFVAPHHPFDAPQDQLDRYDAAAIPLPDAKGGVDPAAIPQPMAAAIGEMDAFSEDVQRRIVHHYLASISLIDDGVGRLMEALERSGQADDTLILFTSDHGEFLGNHGLLRKPSLHYDEVLRVPLLLHMPNGALVPRREDGLVELADVMPTLLGLLDVPSPLGVQGRDWSTALRQRDAIGHDDIYADMYHLGPQLFGKQSGPYGAVQTIRTASWKLNLFPAAGPEYGQLFDLRHDPEERCNRYRDPGCWQPREEMLWRLARRCHLMADPLPPYLTQY